MYTLLISHTADLNGAERCLLELAVCLKAKGENFRVLCPTIGPLVNQLQAQQIPVIIQELPRPQRRLGGLIRFLLLWGVTVWRLCRLIRQEQFQVVYNNTIDGLYGPFAAWLTAVPCVWHIHEVKQRHPLEAKILTGLLTYLPTYAVFNSFATLQAYRATPVAHWSVIYNGIPKPDAPPKRTYQQNHSIIVGFVGQLVAVKRPERFLQAFALASNACPSLEAIVVGDGPLQAEVERWIVHHNIKNNVELVSYTASIQDFYQRFDMLVLTSEREAFGRVLAEAMSFCCPVVAAQVGGVAEVVVDGVTGFLVPPDDISAYTEKIVLLAQDPALRQQMGEAGREHVASRFTIEQYCQQMVHLLQGATHAG